MVMMMMDMIKTSHSIVQHGKYRKNILNIKKI